MTRVMVAILVLVGCSSDRVDTEARRHPDAAVHADAAPPACDPTRAGCVACYASGNPSQACASPSMCCFSNYDSSENGSCQSVDTFCAFGSEHCDGTEDCALGWKCYADERSLPDGSLQWDLSCASAPPMGLAVYQMCHPNSFQCLSPQTCIPARDAGAFNLPAELYVCH